jgi:hypothetical protein
MQCRRCLAKALVDFIAGRQVTCRQVDYDHKNNRPVAVCFAGSDDLQARMVGAGWAWPIPLLAISTSMPRGGRQRGASAFMRTCVKSHGIGGHSSARLVCEGWTVIRGGLPSPDARRTTGVGRRP